MCIKPVFRTFLLLCLLLALPLPVAAQTGVQDLNILINAYPDLHITATIDTAVNDYLLQFDHPETGKHYEFYWCRGAVLPESERANASEYWSLLYHYDNTLRDPADMTSEEQAALAEFTTRENRRNSAGTPMFFFDAVYSATSERDIERHIQRMTFLGKRTRVHERIAEPLRRVEKRILDECARDAELQKFVDGLASCDAFTWRLIDGTNRKSFHSLGIALDMVPVYYGGEAFWSWARDHNPTGWMFTPLRRRWMPPKFIIDAFEAEGFIWGGYWSVWDNMHFEYHPELIDKMKATQG
ncbi:MAG: M15 family metallopeptidase [Treponemataceae bacterium]|nr:M15 family metallopeptidase [Treponemataceae bacterium]